ncbi:rhamnogalacturonan acetylesterase [Catenovulum sp. SX2]|uniref:rhamnogalacturonan acetylesterase n=1 Tax=Catenovulum sp. SX2 TaxID=3398614 RepID=UPI003F850A89
MPLIKIVNLNLLFPKVLISCILLLLTQALHAQEKQQTQVFIVGDSTASFYKTNKYPRTGWGMRLQQHLADTVTVHNLAVSGRSSRSFINEGYIYPIWEQINAGDYLLIQFGHNDQKKDKDRNTLPFSSYQFYLSYYINKARELGAKPILLTSISRYKFDDNNKAIDTHKDYPVAMRQLADKLTVPLIDLTVKTTELLNKLGPTKAKELFLFYQPGEYASYPKGVSDGTHLSEWGADQVVALFVDDLKQLAPELF